MSQTFHNIFITRRWVVNESSNEGPSGEWKERGTGDVRLLMNKANGRVRLLMRQEKTMKIVANHYVVADADPYYELKPNAGSDKIWVWMAQDFAEDELAVEQFALKFGSPEKAQAFKVAFEDAKDRNKKAMSGAANESEAPNSGSPKQKADSPKANKE
jgi:Ran-binding protein 1